MHSPMVSLVVVEFVVYCRMLGPEKGEFESLLKSTCQRSEWRSCVPRSNNTLYLMMANCYLSNKAMHPSP